MPASSCLLLIPVQAGCSLPHTRLPYSLLRTLLVTGSSKPTTMRNESAHTEVHRKYNRTDFKEQYKSMKRAYKAIDWQGEDEPWKVTSAGRHQACTQLLNGSGGQGGVSDEIAERTCNWKGKKAGTMHRYYADLPHIKALAILAGFPKDGSKGYYIHRAHKEPDAELLNMLWPELPAKIEEVIRQREQYNKNDPRRPPDSKLQFLQVMKWLRRVFLQDVPFLMEAHPDHPTWTKHPLFKSDKFKAWKEEVLQFVQDSHMKGQDHDAKVLLMLLAHPP